ncbi:MAG TPA: hypothetical protein VMB51_07125 [Solirubrobacteraceae bacterium]|nr:hypothetical protein [Solirubrobacteraceae bacterium]
MSFTGAARAVVGLAGAAALVCSGSAAYAVSALAASGGARWELSSRAAPTNLPPGGEGVITVAADDLGDAGISGQASRLTLTDVLPTGLRVSDPSEVSGHLARSQSEEEAETWECAVTGEERIVTCSTSLAIPPYERLEMDIPITVQEPNGTTATLPNEVSVEGGEASEGGGPVAQASLTRPVKISEEPVLYGVEEGGFAFAAENEDGSLDTQAGSHPYQLQSTVLFNQVLAEVQLPGQPRRVVPGAPALTKDLSFSLPPGLLGNVTAAGECSDTDFSTLASTTGGIRNLCPDDSAIGVASVTILAPSPVTYKTLVVPLFNLEPAAGEPARFGFETEAVPVVIDTTVHTDGDYGVSATINNATAAAQVLGAQVIFWGDPGDPSHDASRGWDCLRAGHQKRAGEICQPPDPHPTVPFLTLPTSCTGQLAATMQGESWTADELADEYVFKTPLGEPLTELENCPAIPFEPELNIQPQQQEDQNTTSASTPTGLDVNIKAPQEGTLTSGVLGDADVRATTVSLPQGVLLNPGAANGLQACTEEQIGYQGSGASSDSLSPGAPEPLHFSNEPAQCPEASKIGNVRIKTPLLAEELSGSVYLAEQEHNPFGSLIALYILAENEKLGLHVKLAGEGKLDEQTGQITTTFTNTPQVPFQELRLQLFGGPRGSLSTPPWCGSYATTSSFTAWSGASRQPGSEPPFQITSGPDGEPCPSDPLAFAPSFQAGSASLQAGAFTAFTLQIARPDADQALTGLSIHLPAGIAALLSKLTPCPEPAPGQEWACGAESLIGHAVESSGLGGEPFTLMGQVYLTSGYDGAPFGLLVRTLAQAGPFNLGYVNVRSRINIDPHTAQVTITSDPGPRHEAIPTILKGIPVQLKRLEVLVDRSEFEYNPTSCNPMDITGRLTGSQGASTNESSPFQVSNCQNLPFKTTVSASTLGKTSKADGASLKLTFKSHSGEAHVAKTVLTIPGTLPARLTTIQKACIAGVFEANPAGCPEGSDIGTAIVHTPVLKSPLVGPIYLVSHGNAAWPDAELVLQGEGIEVILDGQTAIKKGVTTSSFLSVPDAPFESVEATLRQGPHSALTTNLPLKDHYSLCGQHLTIPTQLTGQNGTSLTDNVKVTVQGCAAVKASKTRRLTRRQKLARALKACRNAHKHSHARRASCERKARRRYSLKGNSSKRRTRTT